MPMPIEFYGLILFAILLGGLLLRSVSNYNPTNGEAEKSNEKHLWDFEVRDDGK